jgi:hypothetical protein
MPRFVILTHDWPFLHWDFLLEQGDVLRSWRLLEEPGPGKRVPTQPIPPHRLAWLELTGPVSNNRGYVTQWDKGSYEVLSESGDQLTIRLNGRKIKTEASLSPVTENGYVVFQ